MKGAIRKTGWDECPATGVCLGKAYRQTERREWLLVIAGYHQRETGEQTLEAGRALKR